MSNAAKTLNLENAQLALQEALVKLDHDKDLHITLLKKSGEALVVRWPGADDGTFYAQRDGHYKRVSLYELMENGVELFLESWDNRKAGYNYRASILMFLVDRYNRIIGLGGYTPMLSTAYMQFYSPSTGDFLASYWIDMPGWAECPDSELIYQRRADMRLFNTYATKHRGNPLPYILLPDHFCR